MTWSATNGWHVHVHALLFFDGTVPDIKGMREELYQMWSGEVAAKGGRKPSRRRGVDCRPVTESPAQVASYLSKAPDRNHISDELTRMDTKQGRGAGSLGPFEFLDDSVINAIGKAKAKRLWLEYAAATKGGHTLTCDMKLRGELGLKREKTDAQIINDTISGDTVLEMMPKAYRKLAKNPNLLSQIQAYIETGEVPLALQLLRYATDGNKQ